MYNAYAGMRAFWSDTTNMDNLRGAAAVIFMPPDVLRTPNLLDELIFFRADWMIMRQGVAGLPTETVIDKDSKSGFGNTRHTFSGDTFEDPPESPPHCTTLSELDGKWTGYWEFTISSGSITAWNGNDESTAISEGCADAGNYIKGETGECGWFNFVVPGYGHVGCFRVNEDGKAMQMMAEPGYIDNEGKI